MYYRLEYSEKQKCFHFEDINKNNANTFGWVTIAEILDYDLCKIFTEMVDDKYKDRPSLETVQSEFKEFING